MRRGENRVTDVSSLSRLGDLSVVPALISVFFFLILQRTTFCQHSLKSNSSSTQNRASFSDLLCQSSLTWLERSTRLSSAKIITAKVISLTNGNFFFPLTIYRLTLTSLHAVIYLSYKGFTGRIWLLGTNLLSALSCNSSGRYYWCRDQDRCSTPFSWTSLLI